MENRTFAPDLTNAVLVVHGGLCFYCSIEGRQEKATSLDHVIPVCSGGETVLENLLPACSRCNLSKNGKILPPEILEPALEAAKASAPAVSYILSMAKSNKDRAAKIAPAKPRKEGTYTKLMRITPSEWGKIEEAIIRYPDKFHTRISENRWFIQACLEKASRDAGG